MQEPYADKERYAELAHEAHLTLVNFLKANGCTCNPYTATAVVQRPNYEAALNGDWEEELVPLVKLLGHEPKCWFFMYGRDN